MFKFDNRNTRARCEIRSKLTIKTPEQRQWLRSGVFIVNFGHISHLALVFLMSTYTCYCRLGLCGFSRLERKQRIILNLSRSILATVIFPCKYISTKYNIYCRHQIFFVLENKHLLKLSTIRLTFCKVVLK